MLSSNSTAGSTVEDNLPDLWYNSNSLLTSSLILLLEKIDLSVSLISAIKSSSFFDLLPSKSTKVIGGVSSTVIVMVWSK